MQNIKSSLDVRAAENVDRAAASDMKVRDPSPERARAILEFEDKHVSTTKNND